MKTFILFDETSLKVYQQEKKLFPELKIVSHYCRKTSTNQDSFNEKSGISETLTRDFIQFSCTWYNFLGRDITLHNGFSWGPTLGCSLLGLAPFVYRELVFILSLSADEVWVSHKEPPEFKFIIKHLFGGNLHFYDSEVNDAQCFAHLLIRRTLPQPPSRTAFRILSIFNFRHTLCVRKKIKVAINEGALESYFRDKKSILLINSKRFFKSIYCYFNTNSKIEIDDLVPEWILSEEYFRENFSKYFKNCMHELNPYVLDIFLEVFPSLYSKHLSSLLPSMKKWLNYYYRLYRIENVGEIYFPGERVEYYCIGLSLANLLKVKTVYILDGFNSLNKFFYFGRENPSKSIFDSGIFFSNDNTDFVNQSNPIPSEIVVEKNLHPLLLKKIDSHKVEKIHDVIIFMLIPIEYNPFCYPDITIDMICSLCKKLTAMGLDVAVKFKGVAFKGLYEKKFTKIKNITFYYLESPGECMLRSRLLITGASTAIEEANQLGVDCLVYEPPENGYPLKSYANLKIKENGVITTEEELIEKIIKSLSKN